MILVLIDGMPFMFFPSLADALTYVRKLSGTLRSRLTLTRYAGHPLSR
jgi:hypothetical protein